MDPDMRKAYNSLYYKRNKKEILDRATAKVTCQNTQAKNKSILDRQKQQQP